jgi:hypothetical protein
MRPLVQKRKREQEAREAEVVAETVYQAPVIAEPVVPVEPEPATVETTPERQRPGEARQAESGIVEWEPIPEAVQQIIEDIWQQHYTSGIIGQIARGLMKKLKTSMQA